MAVFAGTSWKFRKHNKLTRKRRVHLGIDYGVSTSKIVFRDCGAPGGESSVLLLHNGSVRIPSRVCMTTTELLFGVETKAVTACDSYEGVKYDLGWTTKLPDRFSATDLAALTVWFLLSKGLQAVTAHFKGQTEDVEISMTMGLPMEFINNKELKATFLGIACRAWSFYCHEGLLDAAVSIEKARRVLEKHPLALSTLSNEEVRGWIRCEGEAALWLILHSPSVGIGPYVKVDIGAGTTHTNLFRVFGKLQTPKRSLAPFGAGAVPVWNGCYRSRNSRMPGIKGRLHNPLDLSPFLRQTVKTQNSANGMKIPSNGGLSHGFVSTAVHTGVQAGRASAAGNGGVGSGSGAGV